VKRAVDIKPGRAIREDEQMTDQPVANTAIERICPNCQHFYEHGKTEWEDAKECEDCTRRGGIYDHWKARIVMTD